MDARSIWIKVEIEEGIKFVRSETNIIDSFQIKADSYFGLNLSIVCGKQHRSRVARELKKNTILQADISNIISSKDTHHWSMFEITSTHFVRLGACPEEINALLDVINTLEPDMKNSEEVRKIIASTEFVAVPDPLEGKSWDYFGPTHI